MFGSRGRRLVGLTKDDGATQNFVNFMRTVDVYKVCFVNEASINLSCCKHHYGAAESGSRAVDITAHPQGENFMLFCLVGLNNKCFNSVRLVPTNGNDFINFIHEACNAQCNDGSPVIEPGVILVSDCASIHSGVVQDILKPYLNELSVQHIFLAKFSPDMNAAEPYIGKLKETIQDTYFQTLADYSLETAVLAAADTITANDVYQFFKNVSLNYFNL